MRPIQQSAEVPGHCILQSYPAPESRGARRVAVQVAATAQVWLIVKLRLALLRHQLDPPSELPLGTLKPLAVFPARDCKTSP